MDGWGCIMRGYVGSNLRSDTEGADFRSEFVPLTVKIQRGRRPSQVRVP